MLTQSRLHKNAINTKGAHWLIYKRPPSACEQHSYRWATRHETGHAALPNAPASLICGCCLLCSLQVVKMKTMQVISLTLLLVLTASAQVLKFGRCPKPAVQANFDATRVKEHCLSVTATEATVDSSRSEWNLVIAVYWQVVRDHEAANSLPERSMRYCHLQSEGPWCHWSLQQWAAVSKCLQNLFKNN